jgi:apolipoprotein N-acyltransferase
MGIWWVGNALLVGGNPYAWALPFAVLGLQSLLALYPMIAGGLVVTFARGRSLPSFLFFVSMMGLFEWIRGHALTGFPWNLFGMVWGDYLPIAQSVNVIGIYGLSFMTILIASWGGFLWKGDLNKPDKIRVSVLLCIICTSIFAYGSARLHNNPTTYHNDVSVRVISPNIPQEDKWNPILYSENFVKTVDAMNPFFGTTSQNVASTRILVLPETAFHHRIFYDENAMQMLRDTLHQYKGNTYLFTGALRVEQNPNSDTPTYYNSLIAYDRDMNLVETFDKSHLVPFGEYIPFQQYIPIGPVTEFEGMGHGAGVTTWNIPNIPPVSPLVCYEIIFPHAVVNRTSKPRAEWIVNATNDAWYGISPGPYQHLAQTRMRAIEEGVPVIRSANTGISAIIDSYGRVLYQSELFKTEAFEEKLPRAILSTPYSQYGDFGFFVLILLLSSPTLRILANRPKHL